MVEAILRMFTGEDKAAAVLANPLIELIFTILFILFAAAVFIHMIIYFKLKQIKQDRDRMLKEPLSTVKKDFENRGTIEAGHVETFVQEKFSEWRMFGMPVINLIKLVQMTVSVFILIGVLGTFIGLALSLGSINAGGDQLVENVASVLAGIDVAFYTSIAGMGFSLIMTVLTKAMNTEYMLTDIMLKVESELEGQKGNGETQLISVSEQIRDAVDQLRESNAQSLGQVVNAFDGFQAYTASLEQSAKDLAQFNEGLSHNLEEFEALFHNMKQVTEGFQEGTSQLNDNFASLFAYFKKNDAKQERLVHTFENIHEKISAAADTQKESLEHVQSSVGNLESFMNNAVNQQSVIQSSFERIHTHTETLVKQMEAQNKNFKDIFGHNVSHQLGSIINQLADFSKGFEHMRHVFLKLPETLDAINRTQDEYRHLLSGRFEEIRAFEQTFSDHLRSHNESSRTFEQNMQTANQTYEQMTRHNHQVIKDMNHLLSDIRQGQENRENRIEGSLDDLKNSLTSFSNALESTVGDRLDKGVRSLIQTTDTLNDGIRKDLKELTRASQDIQQANSRKIEQLLQALTDEINMLNQRLNTVRQEPARNRAVTGMSLYEE
ncbi:hypothetical protein JNUCC1_00136 [Lentibacillus sp. JNUCC-1]|uniref:MotA/TolQ/ExbB proton channel family protein n=1 Tax=Lentibacillus sp. JNUCC-1 TaxID=2654513 RepID=UPI0012E759DA|nr:MotA/TolQ/ExbB proton channel family protein [Lentibacillus sp. JNUCC-1]MUV36334.1 hypothetical protein [Lentibacillus sp. JNUCC-1]